MVKPLRVRKRRALTCAGFLMILGGLMMFCFFGCGKAAYKVDYCGQKNAYRHARDTYKSGAKVELFFDLIATDTDYSFYLDGERIHPNYDVDKGYILRFTMPDHDVKLEYTAVNSMEPQPDSSVEDVLLVDYYAATVATVGGDGYEEMALHAYSDDQAKLVVYRKDSPDAAEISTIYIVPYMAVERCYAVIDEENMRGWNKEDLLEGLTGSLTVCKFRIDDGSYVRVTSEAMPQNGSQAFWRIRDVLQSFAMDSFKQ